MIEINIKETAGIVAMLSRKQTITVDVAAENIRKVINSMGTPTEKAAKTLQKLGIILGSQ